MNVDLSLRTTEKFLRSDFATVSKTTSTGTFSSILSLLSISKGIFSSGRAAFNRRTLWTPLLGIHPNVTVTGSNTKCLERNTRKRVGFFFVLVFWGFLPQTVYYKWHPNMRTQFVCLSAGTCCAVSESHTLQHGAI